MSGAVATWLEGGAPRSFKPVSRDANMVERCRKGPNSLGRYCF